MRKDPNALMFKDLPLWLRDVLREISRAGFIYLGRTGPGQGMLTWTKQTSKVKTCFPLTSRVTWPFRRECMKQGTIQAIDKHMEYRDIEEKLIVELIATEGPRWVSYRRILEYCKSGVYQTLRQRG